MTLTLCVHVYTVLVHLIGYMLRSLCGVKSEVLHKYSVVPYC
jgi:hypothetical protein